MNKKETLESTSIQSSLFPDLVSDQKVQTLVESNYKKSKRLVKKAEAILNKESNLFLDTMRYSAEEANEICDKAIALDERNKEAFFLKGLIQDSILSYPKVAMYQFSQVINLDPNDFTGWYSRGICKKKLGDFEGAINDYDEALRRVKEVDQDLYESTPRYNIYVNRGNAKQRLNKYEESIEDYNRALKIDIDNHSEAYFNRGNSYYSLKNYLAANQDHKKAIALEPDCLNYYLARGKSYQEISRFEEAIYDFNYFMIYELGIHKAIETKISKFQDLTFDPVYLDVFRRRRSCWKKLDYSRSESDSLNNQICEGINNARIKKHSSSNKLGLTQFHNLIMNKSQSS